jgi:hypothetical protein
MQRPAMIDLAGKIGRIDGHVVRLSHTMIAPGGYYSDHSHVGRP